MLTNDPQWATGRHQPPTHLHLDLTGDSVVLGYSGVTVQEATCQCFREAISYMLVWVLSSTLAQPGAIHDLSWWSGGDSTLSRTGSRLCILRSKELGHSQHALAALVKTHAHAATRNFAWGESPLGNRQDLAISITTGKRLA